MIDFINKYISKILWAIFLWSGSKIFSYVDVYSPDKEIVEAITFSNNEAYIEKISEVE